MDEEALGDVDDYSKHGLGFGLDITKDNPWKGRGPMIARVIETLDDIQQRSETCAFQYYSRSIMSGRDISLKVNTTLDALDVVKVGVDADISRSSAYTLQAVGSRIHTSTFEFKMDRTPNLTLFEKTLRHDIDFDHDLEQQTELLQRRCKQFVANNHCTHYVRAILMGAVEYEVLTMDEFKRIYNVKGTAGIKEHNVELQSTAALRRIVRRRQDSHKYTKIGEWDDQKRVVKKRVIEIEITPIQTLVKTPSLQNALEEAVKEYRKEKLQERPIGPFYIKCRSEEDPLYLKESGNGVITATTEKSKATKFSIDLTKVKHPAEFLLYKFQTSGPTKFLSADVNSSGWSPKNNPPVLKESAAHTSTQRLSLKSPTERRHFQVDPNAWISDGSWLFIRCTRRPGVIKGKGKLCMQKYDSDPSALIEEEGFALTVVPSTTAHNRNDKCMLFCLESTSPKEIEYSTQRKSTFDI